MVKPKLSDFGLTDESLNKYKVHTKNYENEIINKNLRNKVYNSKIKRNSIIAAIIVFIVYVIIIMSELDINQDETPIFSILLFFGMHIFCGLYFRSNKEEVKIADILVEVIGLIFLAPFVSIGFYFYDYYSKTETKVDRTKYINIVIEQKIQRYQQALEKYKDATDKSRHIYWEQLTHYQFEVEVANLYSMLGYSAKVTKASGDGGIDVILIKNGTKIGIQCKHHSKPVGPNDFRALIGVIASQGYDYGIFVSLNGFTTTVYEEARKSRIRVDLVSCKDLVSFSKGIV